jgi:hypothetical protein
MIPEVPLAAPRASSRAGRRNISSLIVIDKSITPMSTWHCQGRGTATSKGQPVTDIKSHPQISPQNLGALAESSHQQRRKSENAVWGTGRSRGLCYALVRGGMQWMQGTIAWGLAYNLQAVRQTILLQMHTATNAERVRACSASSRESRRLCELRAWLRCGARCCWASDSWSALDVQL